MQSPLLPSSVAVSITAAICVLWDDLDIAYARSGGPGGQNVNKVNSKVTLQWHPGKLPEAVRQRFVNAFQSRLLNDGKIAITSQEFRDQPRNLQACLDKLAEMLRSVAKPPKTRRATKPTKGSIERRLRAKQQQSQRKQQRRSPSDE